MEQDLRRISMSEEEFGKVVDSIETLSTDTENIINGILEGDLLVKNESANEDVETRIEKIKDDVKSLRKIRKQREKLEKLQSKKSEIVRDIETSIRRERKKKEKAERKKSKH